VIKKPSPTRPKPARPETPTIEAARAEMSKVAGSPWSPTKLRALPGRTGRVQLNDSLPDRQPAKPPPKKRAVDTNCAQAMSRLAAGLAQVIEATKRWTVFAPQSSAQRT